MTTVQPTISDTICVACESIKTRLQNLTPDEQMILLSLAAILIGSILFGVGIGNNNNVTEILIGLTSLLGGIAGITILTNKEKPEVVTTQPQELQEVVVHKPGSPVHSRPASPRSSNRSPSLSYVEPAGLFDGFVHNYENVNLQ